MQNISSRQLQTQPPLLFLHYKVPRLLPLSWPVIIYRPRKDGLCKNLQEQRPFLKPKSFPTLRFPGIPKNMLIGASDRNLEVMRNVRSRRRCVQLTTAFLTDYKFQTILITVQWRPARVLVYPRKSHLCTIVLVFDSDIRLFQFWMILLTSPGCCRPVLTQSSFVCDNSRNQLVISVGSPWSSNECWYGKLDPLMSYPLWVE